MTTSRRRYLALSPSVIPPVYRDPTQQYTEQVLAVCMMHTAQCPLTARDSVGEAPFQSGLSKSKKYLEGVEGNNRLMYIYTDEAEERFVEDHMDVITRKQVAMKKNLIDTGIDPSTVLTLSKDMGFGEQAAMNASAAQMEDEENQKAEKEK